MRSARYSQAGGFILALSVLAGAIVGGILHQASIGFLAGLAVGVVIAVLIWLVDRRHS